MYWISFIDLIIALEKCSNTIITMYGKSRYLCLVIDFRQNVFPTLHDIGLLVCCTQLFFFFFIFRYDPWSCLCTILDLLICKFWIIIVCLEWSQLDHGEWFFLMCCWLCFVSIVLFNAYVHQSICHISLFMFIVSSLPDFDIRIIFAQKHWEWEPWPLFYFVEWLEDCWMWGTPSSSVFSFTRKYFII